MEVKDQQLEMIIGGSFGELINEYKRLLNKKIMIGVGIGLASLITMGTIITVVVIRKKKNIWGPLIV